MCEEVKRGDLFSGESGIAGSLGLPPPSCFWKRTLEDEWHGFFTGRMPFLLPNQQCQSTVLTQSSERSQEKSPIGIILAWCTARLSTEGVAPFALVLLCQYPEVVCLL